MDCEHVGEIVRRRPERASQRVVEGDGDERNEWWWWSVRKKRKKRKGKRYITRVQS